jgi:hypothetical protein
LFDRRVYGPENLYSVTQKDFCNKITRKAEKGLADLGAGNRLKSVRRLVIFDLFYHQFAQVLAPDSFSAKLGFHVRLL